MGVTVLPIGKDGVGASPGLKHSLLLWPVVMARRAYVRMGARRFAWAMAIAGIVFTLPGLGVGFAQDDHFLNLVFERHPLAEELGMGILDNFAFSDGNLETNHIRTEMGVLPWWTVPDWQVSFWRPLASLSHWIEYKVFGLRALPMHVISLALYGLLCFSAACLYRRIHSGVWVGGLAALMFTLDPVHGIPAGWISDRNALMSALFGVLTLICHDRWRQGGARGLRWLGAGILSLTLGVFSGEAVVSVGAYLFAYQLFLDPQTRLAMTGLRSNALQAARGIVLLVPYLAVILLWRVLYMAMGYGVHGSWMYVDPAAEPWIFAQNIFWYSPIFLLGAYALPDGVAWNFIPDSWALVWSLLAWTFFSGMLWVMWPLLRRSAPARFWLAGSLLSVVPCSATIPGDRIITYPALGAVALVAIFLGDLLESRGAQTYRTRSRDLANAFAGVFVLSHLLLAPVALLAASQSITSMHRFFERASNSIAADPAAAQTDYIALRVPLDMLGASMPLFLIAEDKPLPAHWRYLYAGLDELSVERPDARTLVVTPKAGFLPDGLGQVFRDSRVHPMEAGFTKQLEGMKAEVLKVDADGKPAAVRFTFDKDINDSSMRFVQWEQGVYVPVPLPEPGGSIILPPTSIKDIVSVALELDKASA